MLSIETMLFICKVYSVYLSIIIAMMILKSFSLGCLSCVEFIK